MPPKQVIQVCDVNKSLQIWDKFSVSYYKRGRHSDFKQKYVYLYTIMNLLLITSKVKKTVNEL